MLLYGAMGLITAPLAIGTQFLLILDMYCSTVSDNQTTFSAGFLR